MLGRGCPLLSPPGDPHIGGLLVERTMWSDPQCVSLLQQGDALQISAWTAALADCLLQGGWPATTAVHPSSPR